MPDAAAVTIDTQKPFGPSSGSFSSNGAIPESGTFMNSSVVFEDVDASDSVTAHVTQRFHGALGTFTLRAAITETATEDPHILTERGTWAIIHGTGAYQTLRGRGRITGTADDNRDLITRTYTGAVRRG